MQKFIDTVSSALKALLKGPAWLLWTLSSIFFSSRESPPLPVQSVALSSLSDSPYENAHSQHQRPYERTHSQQQGSTYHLYPPPLRPAAEYRQSPSAHQSSSARQTPSVYQSPSSHQSPSQYTPYQPYRQSSAAHPTPPVSLDVAPVKEAVQSDTSQRSHSPSGPELLTGTPEVVTPVVIDLYEDGDSLYRKARIEGKRMEECFKQSREAYADKNGARAKQLSLKGEAHKDKMRRLDEAASTKIFEENNRGRRFDTIDFHGLSVPQAKFHFDRAVQEVRNHGESSLRVIVGMGNHSKNNIPKIKPAIQEHATSLGLGVEVDPLNEGCLVVSL